MQNLQQGRGAIRLFRIFGIQVYLHWSWFLILFIALDRNLGFSSSVWNIAAYLVLFAIVLTHEFGHALACHSVGGIAREIILWPLGGIAFASPPRRPGAVLWTIAAGPLVNVALVPILWFAMLASHSLHFSQGVISQDVTRLATLVFQINLTLLIFNILPVYPLDGGQILQSLLWFKVGEMRSIIIAATIGLIGCAILLGLAILGGSLWIGIIVFFLASQCWPALVWAQKMRAIERQTPPPFHDDERL